MYWPLDTHAYEQNIYDSVAEKVNICYDHNYVNRNINLFWISPDWPKLMLLNIPPNIRADVKPTHEIQ